MPSESRVCAGIDVRRARAMRSSEVSSLCTSVSSTEMLSRSDGAARVLKMKTIAPKVAGLSGWWSANLFLQSGSVR
jgi:hypothetical protein